MISKHTNCPRGRSLAELMTESGRLGEPESRWIGSLVAAALLPIHERGLAHGDVRPNNVVITNDDEICFTDYEVPVSEPNPNTTHSPPNPSESTSPAQRADIIAVALIVVQCATGVVLDPRVGWSRFALARLGCGTQLARDITTVLADPSDLHSALALIKNANNGSTTITPNRDANQLAPTVSIESTVIAGLPPLPSTTEAFHPPDSKVSWQDALRTKIEHWLNALRRTIGQ